jgi:hypothetical protein
LDQPPGEGEEDEVGDGGVVEATEASVTWAERAVGMRPVCQDAARRTASETAF